MDKDKMEMEQKKRSGAMNALGIFGLIMLGAILIPGIVMLISAIPDIRRYLYIRRM